MIAAIEAQLKYDVAGDPITGIRWTHRTTEKIAAELATLDIQVCPRTVARILKDLHYRLRVNHKRVSAGSGPDRDQQFTYIASQREKFAARGLPIVSIDAKKRELVGNFKNPGSGWAKTPQARQRPRLPLPGDRHRHPLRHLRCNREPWLRRRRHLPRHPPTSLLTTWSDGGSAKAASATPVPVNCWSSPTPAAATLPASAASSMPSRPALLTPTSLPSRSVTTPAAPPSGTPSTIACSARSARTGLAIRCAATRPSSTHIRTTSTATGLRVHAELVDDEYHRGVKITDAEFDSIDLKRHQIQPLRNYSICPRS